MHNATAGGRIKTSSDEFDGLAIIVRVKGFERSLRVSMQVLSVLLNERDGC